MAVCIPAHTCVYEIICVPMYILMDLRWLYAYLDDMHEIIFVWILYSHVSRTAVCILGHRCVYNQICANLYFYGSRTAVWMPRHICMKSSLCEFIFPHILDGCVHTRCVSVMWLTVLYTCVFLHILDGALQYPHLCVWNHALYSHMSWTAVQACSDTHVYNI